MTNTSDFEGFLAVALVFVCTCVHFRRVPALRNFFLSSPNSIVSTALKKTSSIGLKFQVPVSLGCLIVAVLVLVK
ncbi:unnamed protein product [Ectocarpus fasciculatus]